MAVNIVVKPIATYAAVDDTNGGGYVDGYGATYANFCLSTGAQLDNDDVVIYGDFSYSSSGVYDFTTTLGSGFTAIPEGVICRCVLANDLSGTTMIFHAYLTKDPAGVLNYIATGDSNDVDISTLDSAMQNLSATDTLTITYGGALATIEAGAELCKTGLANVMVETGTYIRTASVTDITDLTIYGVDSDGNLALGNDRFLEDLATNAIAHGYQYSTTADSRIRYYNASPKLYSVSGTDTSLVLYTAAVAYTTTLDDVSVRNEGDRNSTYVLYSNDIGHRESGTCNKLKTYPIYRAFYTRNSVTNVPQTYNSIIDATEYSYGRYGLGAGYATNSIIKCGKLLTNSRGILSRFINCLIVAQSATDDLLTSLQAGYGYNTYFDNCIFVGFDELFAATTDVEQELMKNCAFLSIGSIGDTLNQLHQGNFTLSADPFVDSANGDYRLDPDGPDFDKLYDSTNGRALIGATGPELATGGGGGVTYPVLFTSDGGVLYAD